MKGDKFYYAIIVITLEGIASKILNPILQVERPTKSCYWVNGNTNNGI